MLYELRVYEIAPNRMPAIIDRFANVTVGLFKKHGIKPLLFLEPVIGHNLQLAYILQWESLAEREQKWDAFTSDPAWLSARAASEESGPIAVKTYNTIWKEVPAIMQKVRAGQ